MSKSTYGQPWRGLKWDEWAEVLNKPTVITLQKIIDQYSQNTSSDALSNSYRIYLIEQAMQILDNQTPELDNEHIKQIFTGDTPMAPTLHPNPDPITDQKPDSTPEITLKPLSTARSQINAADVIPSPWAYITSYMKTMHLQRMRQIIAVFLQEEYHQSSCLEKGNKPYIPISRLVGGLTISKLEDLDSRWKTKEPKISQLRIEFPLNKYESQLYRFAASGRPVPYRGRGPMWYQNSCAVDCCLVAARLLDLGITVADRGDSARDDWLKTLTPLEEHFLRIIGMPWERISNSTCVKVRDEFYESLLKVMNESATTNKLKNGSLLQATAIWRECTSRMHQFSFSDCRHSECTNCNNKFPKGPPRPNINQDLVIDCLTDAMKVAGEKPDFSQLINMYFDNRLRKCGKCGQATKVERRRVYGNLPPRLVVLPSPEYRTGAIGAESHRMTIKYEDSEGNPHEVVYRWLGGIFRAGLHFRLYWTDEKQGEDTHKMMVYDGQMLGGAIIGSINSRGLARKVPEYWAKETDMLFYERIDLPNSERLHNTAESLKADIDVVVRKLLQGHHVGIGNLKAPEEASTKHQEIETKGDAQVGDSNTSEKPLTGSQEIETKGKDLAKDAKTPEKVLTERQEIQINEEAPVENSKISEETFTKRQNFQNKGETLVNDTNAPNESSMKDQKLQTKEEAQDGDPNSPKEASTKHQEIEITEETSVKDPKTSERASAKRQDLKPTGKLEVEDQEALDEVSTKRPGRKHKLEKISEEPNQASTEKQSKRQKRKGIHRN